MVQKNLGEDALGYFQAVWTISMSYIGFVLGAIGTDYFSRLTAVISDHEAANKMINEQTEVAILLAGPVLLAIVGLAPWIIEVLYSNAFRESAAVLRWQVLGDILKVAGWPLRFVILAAGDGKTFIFTESVMIVIFILLTWAGLPWIGVEATGMAFLGIYLVYLPLICWLTWLRTGFHWQRSNVVKLGLLFLVAVVVVVIAYWSESVAAVFSLIAVVAFSIYALGRLGTMANLNGRLGKVAGICSALMTKLGVWRK